MIIGNLWAHLTMILQGQAALNLSFGVSQIPKSRSRILFSPSRFLLHIQNQMRKLSKYYFEFTRVLKAWLMKIWINPFAIKSDDEALRDVGPIATEDDVQMRTLFADVEQPVFFNISKFQMIYFNKAKSG